MKKIKFFGFLFLIYSCSETKSKNEGSIQQPVPMVWLLKTSADITTVQETVLLNNIKFTGILYLMQANNIDTLLSEEYINGLQDGVSKKWFTNGQLMEIRHFSNGKKNGRQTAYWENGHEKFEFTAKEDVNEGEMKEWNSDGNLIHRANYLNGQEEGSQQLWYNNGKIRANYVIRNGRRFGLLGTKNCSNVSDDLPDFK